MAGSEKNVFGKTVTPYRSHREFIADLGTSPHINLANLSVQGEVGKRGVVVWAGNEIVGAVKANSFIPRRIDVRSNVVKYGGAQAREYVEGSMAREVGMGLLRQRCEQIIEAVRDHGFAYASQAFGGFAQIGIEVERFLSRQDGAPYIIRPEHQDELHAHLRETDAGRSADLRQQAVNIARDELGVMASYPDAVVNSTSMFITGRPDAMPLNNGAYASYVAAVSRMMYDRYFHHTDSKSEKVWDNVARNHGYKNFKDLRRKVGTLAPLSFAAGHASVGLENMAVDRNHYVSTEMVVAVAAMFNSNMGTVAEMMTYSTPFAYGDVAWYEQGGRMHMAQDARAVMRLASKTALPSETVHTAGEFKQKASWALEHGVADRLGRSGQIAEITGFTGKEHVAAAHGRVRHRIEQPSLFGHFDKPLGRVEFVGGPATPDITANVSRNAFLQLLTLGAIEALAHGKYPQDYFWRKFPALTHWKEQKDLAHSYNFDGPNSVSGLLDEAEDFATYIGKRYGAEDVQYAVQLVKSAIGRMRDYSQARSLDEYLNQGMQGTLPDVLKNMYADDRDMVRISHAIHNFQRSLSQRLIENRGDVARLVPPPQGGLLRRVLG